MESTRDTQTIIWSLTDNTTEQIHPTDIDNVEHKSSPQFRLFDSEFETIYSTKTETNYSLIL